jgi:hypothetical protein
LNTIIGAPSMNPKRYSIQSGIVITGFGLHSSDAASLTDNNALFIASCLLLMPLQGITLKDTAS